MAIHQGTETVTITSTERTFRFEVQVGADPVITGHREVRKTSDTGALLSVHVTAPTSRLLSKVHDETVSIPGTEKTSTVGELVEMFSMLIDKWRLEDIDEEEMKRVRGKARVTPGKARHV